MKLPTRDLSSKARRLALIGAVSLLAAWAVAPRGAMAAEPLRAVATFSILGDLVREVGGDAVMVESLIGPDKDAHGFQPSPDTSRKLLAAGLVVANGLGFDAWVDRLVKASGHKGPVVVVSKGLKALDKPASDGHGHGHDHGESDPHAWHAVSSVKLYVGNIRDALAAADPPNAAAYAANATRYLARLDALEGEIKSAIGEIPRAERRVITTHQAFRYYGAAYGVDFFGAKGVSDDAEPTAKEIAELIRRIKRDRIRAIFVENVSGARLLERIAAETNASVGGSLYSDALSTPGGPAPTYVDLMRFNTRAIVGALRPKS